MNLNIIKQLTLKPKSIFLVDSLGALVSAFFLFVILGAFSEYIGMPQIVLRYLSLMAAFFCLYSITCFLCLKDNWRPFLTVISIANLLYCALTIGAAIFYYQSLTFMGIAYFVAETLAIGVLVFVELNIFRKNRKNVNRNSSEFQVVNDNEN